MRAESMTSELISPTHSRVTVKQDGEGIFTLRIRISCHVSSYLPVVNFGFIIQIRFVVAPIMNVALTIKPEVNDQRVRDISSLVFLFSHIQSIHHMRIEAGMIQAMATVYGNGQRQQEQNTASTADIEQRGIGSNAGKWYYWGENKVDIMQNGNTQRKKAVYAITVDVTTGRAAH